MAAPAFNIVLAGEFGVGKTSIFVRYERNTFLKYKGSTFGVDKMTKDVTIDGQLNKVIVWDTVGMERNRSLTSNYYKGAHAVLLVFAVDDSSSLNVLRKWIDDVEKYAPEAKRFLAGNKIDLDEEDIQVKTSEMKSLADNGNMTEWYRVSALTGEGVMEMFDDVLRKVKQGNLKPSVPLDNIFLTDEGTRYKETKKCSC